MLGIERAVTDDLVQFGKEEDAKQRLIKRCMQKSGFKYTPVKFILKRNSGHPNIDKQAKRRSNKNQEYIATLSALRQSDYYTSLYGLTLEQVEQGIGVADFNEPGVGGCVGQAERSMEGVFETRNRYKHKIKQAYNAVAQSSGMQKINADWSQCMVNHNYYYQTPGHILKEMDEVLLSQLSRSHFNGNQKKVDLDPNGLDEARAKSSICAGEVDYQNRRKGLLRKEVNKALKDDRKAIQAAREKARKQKP